MNSYDNFFKSFDIDEFDFYEWGISATIFPDISDIEKEWEKLKYRLFHDQDVYIRGYGRDAHGTNLFFELHKYIFNNSHVNKDRTNNLQPTKLIEGMTKLRKNKEIFNYQISHIWGHTKNALLFTAPWNICYTPKIIDPFTGHEAVGRYPDEYKCFFLSETFSKYKDFISDYNNILLEYHVKEKIIEYVNSLRGRIDEKTLTRFLSDAIDEFSPIVST